MAGSYELRDLDHPVLGLLYEGKLVVDKTYGHASYGCAHCCGYSRAQLWQNPFAGPPNIDNTDIYQAYGVCGSQWYDMDLFLSPHSSNTSVATLTGSTLHTVAVGSATASGKNTLPIQSPNGGLCSPGPMTGTQPVTVQAPTITGIDPSIAMIGSNSVQITINGAGFGTSPTVNLPTGFTSSGQGSTNAQIVITANIGFTATVGNNSITVTVNGHTSNPANFQVDGPYHMVVEGDITGKCSGCSTAVDRRVTYQIQNFSGTNAGTTSICETPTFTGWNCQQAEAHSYAQCSAPSSTNSVGVFIDEWSMASDSYTPAGCGFNIVDYWDWAGRNPVQELGNISGYVHTDKISINGVVSPSQIPAGTVIPF